MPNYPSNKNNPSLTVNNVTDALELKDLTRNVGGGSNGIYPTDAIEGTGVLSNPTQTKEDLDTALTALETEINAYQAAIAAASAGEVNYIENLLSLKFNHLQAAVEDMTLKLKLMTADVVAIDTAGVPTLSGSAVKYPSSYNRGF